MNQTEPKAADVLNVLISPWDMWSRLKSRLMKQILGIVVEVPLSLSISKTYPKIEIIKEILKNCVDTYGTLLTTI